MKLSIFILGTIFVAVIANDWNNLAVLNKGNGVLINNNNGRVVGGQPNYLEQTPFQVSLYVNNTSMCGGSIIAPDWILTAAHCFKGNASILIRAGSLSFDEGGVTRLSTQIIYHPNYTASNLNEDIGLIKLDAPFTYDSYIQPIRLPRRSQVGLTFEGATVQVSGFGNEYVNGTTNPPLKNNNVTVLSNAYCAPIYAPGLIYPCNLCTDTRNGTAGICQGDSGGPATIIDTDGIRTQIGVVSFTGSICNSTDPHGFARTTCFLDWISANTGIAILP